MPNKIQKKYIVYYCSIISLIVLLTSCKKSKTLNYFEGNIKYKIEYVIKTENANPEFLDATFGDTANLYFKQGNFIEYYDGGFMQEQLYRKEENKNYIKKNTSDTIFAYSCAVEAVPIEKYEIKENVDTILGIPCNEYVVYYKDKTISYYYNSDTLSINPEWYSKFTLTNKNINTERMGAMYLRYKIEYPDFYFTVTAVQINPGQISDMEFKLKPGVILVEQESSGNAE